MKLLNIIPILSIFKAASAFGTSSRNEFVQILSTAGIAAFSSSLAPEVANAAAIEKAEGKILRANKCAYGEGEGCEDLAGDNAFIKELQKRSLENKEATQKEYLSAYQMKNYPDFFASYGKFMVKKSDGTFELYDEAELAELKKANKIRLERPTAMGGKVQDLTQKPILVLVE